MDFILYTTTIGSRIDLQAADAADAVRRAVEQEAIAGRPEAKVVDLSYRHPDDGQFRAMGGEALAQIPGTILYKLSVLPGSQ